MGRRSLSRIQKAQQALSWGMGVIATLVIGLYVWNAIMQVNGSGRTGPPGKNGRREW